MEPTKIAVPITAMAALIMNSAARPSHIAAIAAAINPRKRITMKMKNGRRCVSKNTMGTAFTFVSNSFQYRRISWSRRRVRKRPALGGETYRVYWRVAYQITD